MPLYQQGLEYKKYYNSLIETLLLEKKEFRIYIREKEEKIDKSQVFPQTQCNTTVIIYVYDLCI